MAALDRRSFLIGLGVCALGACARGVPTGIARGLRYRSQPGDTLSAIARRAGIPLQQVIAANDLRGIHLRPGTVLILPGVRRLGPDPLAPPPVEPTPAAAQRADYCLVSRRDWGAPPIKTNHDPMRGVSRITIHHTGHIAGMDTLSDRDLVQSITKYHRDHKRWADIGYHYLVGRDGKIYAGRPPQIQGAHSGGSNNEHNLGVAMIGCFDYALPHQRQLQALSSLVRDLGRKHAVARHRILAHRDLGVTDCPGDALYRWFRRHRDSELTTPS
ncbi:MAG: N-acetylmuramoyl-L-alanine amidase [Planctomycetota bacterium]